MGSESYVRHSFKLLGEKVCFVISVSRKQKRVSCISLFGADDPSYSTVQAIFQSSLKYGYQLKNEDPPDHEEIHKCMGKEMNLNSEETKKGSRHFHWVCSLEDASWSALILEMCRYKWMAQKEALKIILAIQALDAL